MSRHHIPSTNPQDDIVVGFMRNPNQFFAQANDKDYDDHRDLTPFDGVATIEELVPYIEPYGAEMSKKVQSSLSAESRGLINNSTRDIYHDDPHEEAEYTR